MKTSERIRRNMQLSKPAVVISFRLPNHVIEDLKGIAPSLGFGSYQALIRAYISSGLRQHLAERESPSPEKSPPGESSGELIGHEIPEQPA